MSKIKLINLDFKQFGLFRGLQVADKLKSNVQLSDQMLVQSSQVTAVIGGTSLTPFKAHD